MSNKLLNANNTFMLKVHENNYLFKEINFLDKLISLYNSDLYLFNYKITKPNGSIEIVQSFDEKLSVVTLR